jgi:ABC-type cobalamin transport system permease subunit
VSARERVILFLSNVDTELLAACLAEIPIGVVTAGVGAPAFWLLLRTRRA